MSHPLTSYPNFRSLWSACSLTQRVNMAHFLWIVPPDGVQDAFLETIGERLHTRKQTVSRWPLDKKVQQVAKSTDWPEILVRDTMRLYLLGQCAAMLREFLDTLGIKHNNCIIEEAVPHPPAVEALSKALSNIITRYSVDDVVLCCRYLLLDSPERWYQLEGLDLESLPSRYLEEPALPSSQRDIPAKVETDGRDARDISTIKSRADETESSAQPQMAEHDPSAQEQEGPALNISELQQKLAELSATLSNAAVVLADGRLANTEELRQQLLEADLAFKKTAADMIVKARNCGIPDTEHSSLASSIYQLEILAVRISLQEAACKQLQVEIGRAQGDLKRVCMLRRRDGQELPSLSECHNKAQLLAERLESQDKWSEDGIYTAMAPFRSLMALTVGLASLDDESMAREYESVSIAFGGALAAAAIRQKLEVPGAEDLKPQTNNDRDLPDSPRQSIAAFLDDKPPASLTPAEGSPTTAMEPETSAGELQHTQIEAGSSPHKESAALEEESSLTGTEESPETSRLLDLSYRSDESTADYARLLAESRQVELGSINRLVWMAARDGRLSAAYHLERASEEVFREQQPPMSALLRAVALANEILGPGGGIADQLQSDYELLAQESIAHSFRSADLAPMLAAAAMRPALVAPHTRAANILKLICENLSPQLRSFCHVIEEYAAIGLPLDPARLRYIDDNEKWQTEQSALVADLEAWHLGAEDVEFAYPPAANIWRYWLGQGRLIYSIVEIIRSGDPRCQDSLLKLTGRVSTEPRLHNEVNSVDKSMRKRAVTGGIPGPAFNNLRSRVNEVLGLATRWLDLMHNQPGTSRDFAFEKMLALKRKISQLRGILSSELHREDVEITSDLRYVAGIACCERAAEGIYSILHGAHSAGMTEPAIRYVLGADLVLIPGLELSDGWEPIGAPTEVILSIATFLSLGDRPSLEKSFTAHSDVYRDHSATDRLLELAAHQKDTSLQALEERQEVHVKRCLDALHRELIATKNSLERAVTQGIIHEKKRGDFLFRIESLQSQLPVTRNFGAAQRILQTVNTDINTIVRAHADEVRKRLIAEGIDQSHPAYPRIIELLEKGDIGTANEYIQLASQGETPGVASAATRSLSAFFPTALDEIDSFLSDPRSAGAIISRIGTKKGIPGVPMRDVTDVEAEQSVEALEAWYALKKAKRVSRDQLKTVISYFGFNLSSLTDSSSMHRAWIEIQAETIADRERCPIPYFGSDARGQYRILCIWDRLSEEEILTLAGPSQMGNPLLVLYFGRFGELGRRNLARLSRMQRRTFALIDESLLLYLCSQSTPRLSRLMECTLPFTFLNPYTIAASHVAPEMFYGRMEERMQIMAPMGSCFIFGGRQLGKTALLLSVRDEFHSPSEGRIATWIDLKASGVTQNDIWPQIVRSLMEAGDPDLFPARFNVKTTEQRILDRIYDWIQKDPQRRILLLLDEADKFLESDILDEFRRTSALKGLMDRTNRRFKVVFAGLHNVRRTLRQQNHPLAHLGQAICVGPLLDRGEWQEAKALIERPLAALGYCLEPSDLVLRILYQTNYYPSLIQVYCSELLQHLTRGNAAVFDWRTSPPYLIKERHVDEAYSRTQGQIRERFDLTLNLDARYRAIALVMALYSQPGSSNHMQGLAVSQIRRDAVCFWERGFHDCRTEDDFKALLEEMVGLGVLRELSNGRYVLRSQNMLSLLGTQVEIEEKLEQLSTEDPPPVFEPQHARTFNPTQNWIRNPLTIAQEGDLRSERTSVTVLFGCKAAGLLDLRQFLASGVGEDLLFTCGPELTSRMAFNRVLMETRDRLQAGTSMLLVQDCPWTGSWIEEALEWMRHTTLRTKYLQIIFVADPQMAWSLIHKDDVIGGMIETGKIGAMSLKPWHDSVIWRWLGDCGIGSNAVDERRAISDLTGNWPTLLYRLRHASLHDHVNFKSQLNAIAEQLGGSSVEKELIEEFGLTTEETVPVFKEMAALGGPVSTEDLKELLEGHPREIVNDVLSWGNWLSLVRPASDLKWELDSTVARLLRDGIAK